MSTSTILNGRQLLALIQADEKARRRERFETGRASVQHTKRQRNGRAYNRAADRQASRKEAW